MPRADHVDGAVFGALPLELYMQERAAGTASMGLAFADAQWDNPLPDGLTNQTRWWIDDMYMITALQLQAYRATGDAKYLDRAAREMVAYLASCSSRTACSSTRPTCRSTGDAATAGWPWAWPRCCANCRRSTRSASRCSAAYRRMMATLLKHQADSGMWRQLIDHPESWEESSSTAMFTYAFVTGVKNGWLPEDTYGPAARKAWIALVGYLTPDGDLREVCVGTGKKDRPAALPGPPARRGRRAWPGADALERRPRC